MKASRIFITSLVVTFILASVSGLAADKKTEKPKPYPLKTCVVSDDKLGEMGAPYVFVHEGREIKLCCKSCLKDFKKDTAKYIKKVEEAEAKARKDKS
ncbi:MAG TPA: hypothetical protein P5205_18950 [Candidatus Paceibacterota bacterium]|nr:hypothetical protein [Verrucomicrobiota bacterium]HSA12442.1 hypothetical protein [Candidatus Paceibacterota bacterium]